MNSFECSKCNRPTYFDFAMVFEGSKEIVIVLDNTKPGGKRDRVLVGVGLASKVAYGYPQLMCVKCAPEDSRSRALKRSNDDPSDSF